MLEEKELRAGGMPVEAPYYYRKEQSFLDEPKPDPGRRVLRMIRLDPFIRLLREKHATLILFLILLGAFAFGFLGMLVGDLLG